MCKKIVILFCFTVFCLFKGYAQDPLTKEMEDVNKEFEMLKDSIDNEFENLKKAIWKEFEGVKIKIYGKPKPKVIPLYKPKPPLVKPTPFVVTPVDPIKIVPELVIPKHDFIDRSSKYFKQRLLQIIKNSSREVVVDFYGAKIPLYYNDLNLIFDGLAIDNIYKGVKLFDKNKSTINDLIYQLANHATVMQLNDYQFLNLTKKTGLKIFNDNAKAILFTWYVSLKKEYDSRIAYQKNGKGMFFLAQSNHQIYDTYLFHINKKKYYAIPFDANDASNINKIEFIRTYAKNPFDLELKRIDFNFQNAPSISDKSGVMIKSLTKYSMGDNFNTIKVNYNISYIEMLKEFPRIEYSFYFQAPVSKKAAQSLKTALLPQLSRKSEVEKVKTILNFVHNFPYKLDSANFKKDERPLTAEEMLFYRYSDCEDHSALFSYLINEFTNCEVIGLLLFTKTSGHATTAVKFPNGEKPNGYYMPPPFNDYIMCDGTFFGAPIGSCQTQFIGVNPAKVFKVAKRKNKY